jgi:hypothetical protein
VTYLTVRDVYSASTSAFARMAGREHLRSFYNRQELMYIPTSFQFAAQRHSVVLILLNI